MLNCTEPFRRGDEIVRLLADVLDEKPPDPGFGSGLGAPFELAHGQSLPSRDPPVAGGTKRQILRVGFVDRRRDLLFRVTPGAFPWMDPVPLPGPIHGLGFRPSSGLLKWLRHQQDVPPLLPPPAENI